MAYDAFQAKSVIRFLDRVFRTTKIVTGMTTCINLETIYNSLAEVWHPLIEILSVYNFLSTNVLILSPVYFMRHEWGGPLIIILEFMQQFIALVPCFVLGFPISVTVFLNWIISKTFTEWKELNSFLFSSIEPFEVYVKHWMIGVALLPIPTFFMFVLFLSDSRHHVCKSFILFSITRLLVYLKQNSILLIITKFLFAGLTSALIVFSFTPPLISVYKLLYPQEDANIAGKKIFALIQQSSSFDPMAGAFLFVMIIFAVSEHLKDNTNLASSSLFKKKKGLENVPILIDS